MGTLLTATINGYIVNNNSQTTKESANEGISQRSIDTASISSVQSLDRLDRRGGHEGRFSRGPLPVFPAGSPCEQLWHEQECPHFHAADPTCPLPTAASPTLQGALKDGFGEAVVACDIPDPCKFLYLDSCQKRSLWIHKEVGLAPHQLTRLTRGLTTETKIAYVNSLSMRVSTRYLNSTKAA